MRNLFVFVAVVELIHAVIWAGGTAVLMSPLSTVSELAHCITLTRPKVIAVDESACMKIEEAVGEGVPITPKIILGDFPTPKNEMIPVATLYEAQHHMPPLDLSTGDDREFTAAICFSSGTSGKAKAVELSHHSLIGTLISCRQTDYALWNAAVRTVFFAPLCHIYGFITAALGAAWFRSYMMLMRHYTLPQYLLLSAKTRANSMRILPSIAVSLTKVPSSKLKPLSPHIRTIMCSGAVLPADILAFLQRMFKDVPVYQSYGTTESNIATLTPFTAYKQGSVGKLFAGVEARVVDDDRVDVGWCEQGECLVKGPAVFRRYRGDEDATKEAFLDGWMRTGDVVRIDEEGFVYMIERKKELIKYKGFQVPPVDLETHLATHHYVLEAAVCAMWDSEQGTEVPVAYVVLTDQGKEMLKRNEKLLEGIRDHVDSRVAPYKRLRGGVQILKELPKSSTGKVLKRMLPARIARERGLKL